MARRIVDREHYQLRDVLRERDEVFARCEKLNAMCIELATDYAKAEAERDEARRICEELRVLLDERHQRYIGILDDVTAKRDDARQWARKFRAKSRGMEGDRDLWRALCRGADEEVDRLRAQLAEARNKALRNASLAAQRALFIRDIPHETIKAVCAAIVGLQGNS